MDILHDKPGLASSLYQPLGAGDVKKIANEAIRVLEKGGMAVYSKSAREAFRAAGAEVDDEKNVVRLPRSLVEDAIASNPSSITLHARDGEDTYDCVLEKNRVHYGTGGTAIYVLDRETGERRPSTVRDVINNARMVQALKHIHLFTINVFPHDVEDNDNIDPNRFYHAFNNTTRHVMGGIYSMAGCKKVVEMAEMIAGSPEKLRAEPFVSFITLIISPFKIDDHYGEMTCYLAKENLPVVVPTEPICGTTAPITLAGNILTHVAESLGGIALVQCVRKGAPGIFGSVGSITNLRTMQHVAGGIERAMINAAVSQLAQHFELPLYSTGGTTDSKKVDTQAALESAMSSLLVAMSGANYIHDIAGLMEEDLTVSYDKLALDNEILGMCQRVLRGVEVTDDTLAADLLIEKGPGGHFLGEMHTMDFMNSEFFMPELASREPRDQMAEDSDMLSQAKKQAAAVLDTPGAPLLGEALRKKICDRFPEIQEG
jgi:trimethylamine---corrinoid protein Co-methyltransferase